MNRPSRVEIEVRPPWPYRLPGVGRDGIMRRRGAVLHRLLHVSGDPILVQACVAGKGAVVMRASAVGCGAGRGALELALERMRFALGVDVDLSGLYARFRSDPLIGPAIRRRPWVRPKRRPWPWEALAWAITEQLIEAERAALIQRRIVRRWSARIDPGGGWRGPGPLHDAPSPAALAALAPAQLAALELAPARALTLIKAAREVAGGRLDPGAAEDDRRLSSLPGIGPWTLQCLGLSGRGEADSLPAGDLAYVKLVGRLAGLGRRATVDEVEEFFAPYRPFRGLAGLFALVHHHKQVAAGPPLRLAA